MKTRPRRAFSLLELLVVATILAVLVALLVPGLTAAWQTASMTRCKSNLNTIWTAQAVWRADYGGRLMTGGSWMSNLLPYVERKREVFLCTGWVAGGLDGLGSWLSGSSSGGEGGGSEGGEGEGTGGPAYEGGSFGGGLPDYQTQPPQTVEWAFEFDIWWQAGSYGDYMSGSGLRGELAYQIPLESHPWVRRTDMGDCVLYEVDDEGSTGGAGKPITYDDIKFKIYYDSDGQPLKLEILKQSCNSSPYKKYFYDFKVNGEVFISNWVQHIGETFTFDAVKEGGSPGAGAGGGAGGSGAFGEGTGGGFDAGSEASGGGGGSAKTIWFGDYALNRGTYDTGDRLVTTLDPKLIYILDYGRKKTLAEYVGMSNTWDEWDMYFIRDPEEWQREPWAAGKNWREYQALRHFGQANVLFADGHIESLGPDDPRLLPTSPYWCYGRQ